MVDFLKAWILVDPHYNHANLVRRGNRPEGYEERISSHWTAKVGTDHTVYCLGDVCMGKQAESHERYVEPMPGYKILILGNHDRQKKGWYLDHGWDEVHEKLVVWVNGRPILLSHKPQVDDGSFSINVHGHFHNDIHRLMEPEMLAIRSPKHRLLALECVDYSPVPFVDFINGKITQDGLPQVPGDE
jgi:calcineurin-like phosphoesterase family protein